MKDKIMLSNIRYGFTDGEDNLVTYSPTMYDNNQLMIFDFQDKSYAVEFTYDYDDINFGRLMCFNPSDDSLSDDIPDIQIDRAMKMSLDTAVKKNERIVSISSLSDILEPWDEQECIESLNTRIINEYIRYNNLVKYLTDKSDCLMNLYSDNSVTLVMDHNLGCTNPDYIVNEFFNQNKDNIKQFVKKLEQDIIKENNLVDFPSLIDNFNLSISEHEDDVFDVVFSYQDQDHLYEIKTHVIPYWEGITSDYLFKKSMADDALEFYIDGKLYNKDQLNPSVQDVMELVGLRHAFEKYGFSEKVEHHKKYLHNIDKDVLKERLHINIDDEDYIERRLEEHAEAKAYKEIFRELAANHELNEDVVNTINTQNLVACDPDEQAINTATVQDLASNSKAQLEMLVDMGHTSTNTNNVLSEQKQIKSKSR